MNSFIAEFRNNLRTILESYNGSVNFYMFHGGTNFGFLNGANQFPLIFPYVRHHTASYGQLMIETTVT